MEAHKFLITEHKQMDLIRNDSFEKKGNEILTPYALQ